MAAKSFEKSYKTEKRAGLLCNASGGLFINKK